MAIFHMFDSAYSKYYDLLNAGKPYKDEIKFVYEWADKPKSIFDIGAGTGSYWKYYPSRVKIFGIDKSPSMIGKREDIVCADITTYKHKGKFDCATALFDVLNYIPEHTWWKNIPLEKGGCYIFDILDKDKIDRQGFSTTIRTIKEGDLNILRRIIPVDYDGKSVKLRIEVNDNVSITREEHQLFLYSIEDIAKFCGKEFEIEETLPTKTWQRWFRLRRK